MKSVLIIGAGQFGKHLADKFMELGDEVVIIDNDAEIINDLTNTYTRSIIADCMQEKVISSLGVNNYDLCFVTPAQDLEIGLEITALLKKYNAKKIISRASKESQAKFLKAIGADDVVYFEKEMAEKLAVEYNIDNVFKMIQVSDDSSMFEMGISSSWIGKSLRELNVRAKYGINIFMVSNDGNMITSLSPDYMFKENDHIYIVAKNDDIVSIETKIEGKAKRSWKK